VGGSSRDGGGGLVVVSWVAGAWPGGGGGVGDGVAAGTFCGGAGVLSGATWVGAAGTGSPGTAGSWAAGPSTLPLNAITMTPAVHSAAAIRPRLVRCVVRSGLTVISV
jgi:hypothetical protein